jgi:glycosyltransferase involved in cell wall biosynthesis
LYEITWLLSAARSLGQRGDVILGVVPSLSGGVLAYLLSRRLKRPYGLIFQDLMGSAASQSGYSGALAVARAAKSIEIFLAKRAQGVAVVADGFRDVFESSGIPASRICRVRNWTRDHKPTATPTETRRRLGWDESDFVCLHAGNMGQKQGLDNLLGAARLLGHGRTRIVLAGDGNDRTRLVEIARREGAENVSFVGVQPEGSFEAMLQAADILLINQRASVRDMALPSKLTSYFASGRPIVAAVSAESETAREIQAAGVGTIVPPESPGRLADAIRGLVKSGKNRNQMSARGEEYVATHLLAEKALPAFDAFLRQLVARPLIDTHRARSNVARRVSDE